MNSEQAMVYNSGRGIYWPRCTCRFSKDDVIPADFASHDLPCEFKLWLLYDEESPLWKDRPWR